MRGIFAKTTFLLLVIGLLPLIAMGLWTWSLAESRLTRAVVEYWLVRLARETADALDREVGQMRGLAEAFGADPLVPRIESGSNETASEGPERRLLRRISHPFRLRPRDLDLVVCFEIEGGKILAARTQKGPADALLRGKIIDELPLSPRERAFFLGLQNQSRAPEDFALDWHRSHLLALAGHSPRTPLDQRSTEPRDYALSFATIQPAEVQGASAQALVFVFNWGTIQSVLDEVARRFRTEEGSKSVRYDLGYPFLFAEDCTTIIGHERRHLYGLDMARDVDPTLVPFRDLMRELPYGHYQYEYPKDAGKITGFARCKPAPIGFAWAVGIGLYHEQVYSDVRELEGIWIFAGGTVFLIVLLLGASFSTHLTRPILQLAEWARDFGRGAPREPLSIRTRDEIQDLAESFSNMAHELQDKEVRLVQAEKETAWRTMAQQVAHEIKNPLTPILLSAQNIRRAVEIDHPRWREIVNQGTQTIEEQCDALRSIAGDFATFASTRHERLPLAFDELVASVIHNFSRSEDPPIELALEVHGPRPIRISADAAELRRVFLNLFNNAIEAFGAKGGRIAVTIGTRGERVLARVEDDGPGVLPEHVEKLFEPRFSTRSTGTGLGLAICRAILERHGGSLRYEAPPEGKGAAFVLELPLSQSLGGL